MRTPEFMRVQWTSMEAMNAWANIIGEVGAESHRVEVESVKRGLRRVGFITGNPDYIRQIVRDSGLDFLITNVSGKTEGYNAIVPPYQEGKPFDLRVVIGPRKWVDCFHEAQLDRDDAVMGNLLGYPKCCVANFKDLWVDRNIRDFTWNNVHLSTNQGHAVVLPWTPILPVWMRLNLRAFYHVPCSYRCTESYNLVREYAAELWDTDLWNKYCEILSWPVEYSALHGAAEVRTPILKLVHNTQYSSTERVIQFVGTNYPAEGARSDRFPYNLKHNISYNNGFVTVKQMDYAHEPILDAARSVRDVKTVYDPGCGNGHLLMKLQKELNCEAKGCDLHEHAILEGRLLDDFIGIEHKNMFDVKYPSADLVVLMPGRLAEVSETTAREYVARLNYRYLILYVYQDNADLLWYLKEKFFPQLRIVTQEVNASTTALLLEKQ